MDDMSYGVVGDAIVKPLVTSAWKKVCNFFKDSLTENEIDYGSAYESYLNNTRKKYSKVKTLIYRHTPKDLYSFYESCNLRYESNIIDTSNINNVIKDFSKVIITGTGGIGKTTLLRHLYLNTIKETNFIPVFVELRNFNDKDNISLRDLIYQNLKENGFELEDKYYEYSLKKGAYVFLLDGFDEVNGNKKCKVQKCIQSFSDTYRNNRFIITSRPMDDLISLNDFTELESMELNKKQALSLISKIEFDEYLKEKFCDELNRMLYAKYKSFASNPLLLTIMLLTFEAHASIPDNLKDFYEQAFMTLFNMHDATKLAYKRDIRSNLGYNDFKTVFSYICFKSYFNSEYQFSHEKLREYIIEANNKFSDIKFNVNDFFEDLMLSVCMIIRDGNEYIFTHRTFQEYFAALYTCKLTDEYQKKLLKLHLRDIVIRMDNDEYMKMLISMQNDKFINIILIPALKQLKKKYDEVGFSYELFSELFRGIRIMGFIARKDNKREYHLFLGIKDRYMCNILEISSWIKGSKRIHQEYNQDIILKLIELKNSDSKIKKNKNALYDFLGWDFIKSTGLQDEILVEFKWVEKQLLDSFELINRYSSEVSAYKKTLRSFLDTL